MMEVKSQTNDRLSKGPSASRVSSTKVAQELSFLIKQARDSKATESREGSILEKDALSKGTLARVKNISKERRSAKDVQVILDDADKQSKLVNCDIQDTDANKTENVLNTNFNKIKEYERGNSIDNNTYENITREPNKLERAATLNDGNPKRAVPEQKLSSSKLAAEFSTLLEQARNSKKFDNNEYMEIQKEVMSKGTVARVKHISKERKSVNSIQVNNPIPVNSSLENKERKHSGAKTNEGNVKLSSWTTKYVNTSKTSDTISETNTSNGQRDTDNTSKSVMKKRRAPKVPEHNELQPSPIVKKTISPQELMKDGDSMSEHDTKSGEDGEADNMFKKVLQKRTARNVPSESELQHSTILNKKISQQQLENKDTGKQEVDNSLNPEKNLQKKKSNEYDLSKVGNPTESNESIKIIRKGSRRSSEGLNEYKVYNFLKEEKRRSSFDVLSNHNSDKDSHPCRKRVPSENSAESSREVQLKALRELHNQARHHTHPECAYGNMIPEPDYSDDEQAEANTKSAIVNRNNTFNNAISKDSLQQERVDDKGLIIPKKLVNPNLESTDKKQLHRELKFNQKAGVNVLNQKTELQRALEKQKDKKALKEQAVERQEQLTPLQKAMESRAQKIEKDTEKDDNKISEKDKNSSEFEKVHAKLRGKLEI